MKFRLRNVAPWKIAALIVSSFAVLVLAVWGWIYMTIERRWSEMDRAIQSPFEEARALEQPRPLLHEAPVSGDAWDSYMKAIPHLDDPKTALEHLHRGARCDVATSPYEAVAPDASPRFERMKEPWYELARLAVLKAENLRKEGRAAGATDTLLDLCQLGRDLAQNGSPTAWSCGEEVHRMAFDGLRNLVVQGNLPKEVLLRLERTLRSLDESSHSRASDVLNAAALLGRAIRNDRLDQLRGMLSEDPLPRPPVPTWRSAWSLRLEKVKSFDLVASWLRRLAVAESHSWTASKEECDRIRQEVEARAASHSVLQNLGFQRLRPDRHSRMLIVKLRLLRIASRFLATGEVLELKDPFGTKLMHSVTESHLKLWSVAAGGVDIGGDVVWDAGIDGVLEVRR